MEVLCNSENMSTLAVQTEKFESTFSLNSIDEYGNLIALKSLSVVLIGQWIFHILTLVFGSYRLLMYKYYSVNKSTVEKSSGSLFFAQVTGHWIISMIWILQFVLILTVPWIVGQGQYNFGHGLTLLVLLNGLFIWPMIGRILQEENTKKFSTEVDTNDHHVFLKWFWKVNRILDIISFLTNIWLWNLSNDLEKVFVGFALSRIIILFVILYLSEQRVGFPKTKEEKKDEESKSLSESFSNYWKQWSLFKKYTILGTRAQFSILICFATVGIGRVIKIYMDVVNKRLLDSMSISPGINGTLGLNASRSDDSRFKLEFRWDYLVLTALLQFVNHDILDTVNSYIWDFVSREMSQGTQLRLYKKVQNLSLRWHLKEKGGSKLNAISYGQDQITWFLRNVLFETIPNWLDVIIYLIYVATVYNRLLNTVIFLTTAATLVLHIYSVQRGSKIRKAKKKSEENKLSESLDALSNYETVKYFTNEDHEANRFAGYLEETEQKNWAMNAQYKWERLGKSLIRNIGSFLGSLICYWMIVNREGLTVGDYHLFGTHLFQFYRPFLSLTYTWKSFKFCTEDLEKITNILEEKPEVDEKLNAPELNLSGGKITFQDVNFHYAPEREILHGINFEVPSGQTFALVGPTGAGKSTITKLLFRFYDTTGGKISIDDQDIRNISLRSLRKQIGVIPQDTVLFHTSIRDNILYGNLSSTDPDEDVIGAAKCACLHDKIQTYPEKYKTVVGNRGLMLSGGERQRVSIARAVMKNPPILLLDEATSSLDTSTERLIQSSLEEICKNRTTLIIAHRLSTIVHADNILVLDEGRIIESGSHAELLDLNGTYARMWKEQATTNMTEETEKSRN